MSELSKLKAARERVGRDLDRNLHERGECRQRIDEHEREVTQLTQKRKDKKKKEPADDKRAAELNRQIAKLHDRIADHNKKLDKLIPEERELTDRIEELRGRRGKIVDKIADAIRAIQRKKVVVEPGAPHWGGCEDIIRNEVVPTARKAGATETSGKRSETFGNPGSDHYVGNTTASARDFAHPQGLYCMVKEKIAAKLRIGSADYASEYIRRAGRTFRVQQICENHGTGPHCHTGLRLV